MIKRILLALDTDPDTVSATRYSAGLAEKFDATCLWAAKKLSRRSVEWIHPKY